MRLCSLSVDLDEMPNYYALYGLPSPVGRGATAVYDVALERLEALGRAYDVPLTLFAIGRDMDREPSAKRLRAMAAAGHEIGNHTLDHYYDLTRRTDATIRSQISEGADRIERATGQRPTGFRAPGYTMTDAVYRVLGELAVAYSSSVFPCAPYYLVKAAKMIAISARGRRSQSILDRPSVLRAPTGPYRVGTPYWRRGSGLLELPIQVTRGLRLPLIGTTLTMAGPSRARWLTRMVIGEPFVNLELHGIDVLDTADGFEDLRVHQPDARIPHRRKLAALSQVIELLKEHGYRFVRLDEAAEHWRRRLH